MRKKHLISFLVIFFFCFILSAPAFCAAKKAESPQPSPYRTSGSIGGTDLLFRELTITKQGASVMIINPGRRGTFFNANFAFFDAKNQFLTGFTLEGYAAINNKNLVTFPFNDLKKLRKATDLKVIGRIVTQ